MCLVCFKYWKSNNLKWQINCTNLITTLPKVFFRDSVSLGNPQGREWREICLPKDVLGVISCSCSKSGLSGFITWAGSVLIRTGITRTEPYGSTWIEIQKPFDIGLRQLCIGSENMWALDNQGSVYYRTGINKIDNNKNTTKWIQVPGTMNALSLSYANQVHF